MYISPMRDSIDAGLHPTNHTDFVVAPLDQMFMLWSAVNRISRSGEAIGLDQASRRSRAQGDDPVGRGAVRRGSEQGLARAGKLADLVVLDANPLKVARRTSRASSPRDDQGRQDDLHREVRTVAATGKRFSGSRGDNRATSSGRVQLAVLQRQHALHARGNRVRVGDDDEAGAELAFSSSISSSTPSALRPSRLPVGSSASTSCGAQRVRVPPQPSGAHPRQLCGRCVRRSPSPTRSRKCRACAFASVTGVRRTSRASRRFPGR